MARAKSTGGRRVKGATKRTATKRVPKTLIADDYKAAKRLRHRKPTELQLGDTLWGRQGSLPGPPVPCPVCSGKGRLDVRGYRIRCGACTGRGRSAAEPTPPVTIQPYEVVQRTVVESLRAPYGDDHDFTPLDVAYTIQRVGASVAEDVYNIAANEIDSPDGNWFTTREAVRHVKSEHDVDHVPPLGRFMKL